MYILYYNVHTINVAETYIHVHVDITYQKKEAGRTFSNGHKFLSKWNFHKI